MHRGYFAIWRKIEEHPFYKEPRVFSKYEAWLDIFKSAQYEDGPKDVILGLKVIECHYGEILKSNLTWAKQWGWSEAKVRRFLKLLVNMGQIRTESVGITTRIMVVNFEHYDPRRRACDDDATRLRRDCDETATTKKKVKNNICETNTRAGEIDDATAWKSSFDTYLSESEQSAQKLLADPSWVSEQEQLNPNVDIRLTMRKAYANYWSTEEAWKKLKAKRIKAINWKATWQNALSNRINRVYLEKGQTPAAREPTAAEKARLNRKEMILFTARMQERENEIKRQQEADGGNDSFGTGPHQLIGSGE